MTRAIHTLTGLHAHGVLTDVDVLLARALGRLSGEQDDSVLLAVALASRQVREGDVCLDVHALCSGALSIEAEDHDAGGSVSGQDEAAWPPQRTWLAALSRSPLVQPSAAEPGGALTPLVLDAAGRLYLRRYYDHELRVAELLLERASAPPPALDEALLARSLDRYFPAPTDGGVDLQRVAAERAARGRLCVISGGPGTGKTTTVAKLLALIIEQALAVGQRAPRVELLAPTGKAAARLSESIRDARESLKLPAAIGAAIRDDARTIHRALGLGLPAARRASAERPLGADVVVADEASMVDLELMSQLLGVLMPDARLILLGDQNQLASVEAGAVLGELCGRARDASSRSAQPQLAVSIVQLERSYRFPEHTGIGKLAAAIVRGDANAALAVLQDPSEPTVSLVAPRAGRTALTPLLDAAFAGFGPLFDAPDAASRLAALERFRILCALRRGPFGQLAVNAALEARVRKEHGIEPGAMRYPGRPLLVTRNDATARLWNGDLGVLVSAAGADAASSEPATRLVACFAGDARGGELVRRVSIARLPPHESAYAMSVHKSQGSELDEVHLLLPPEPSPVLCRELLYTAVTRARQRVVIHGSAAIVRHAIERPVRRASGLSDLLWGPPSEPTERPAGPTASDRARPRRKRS
jgi:exodeoxyribonuclease V alpha subunit